ncbi:apoptosis regulator BAX-like isoform X1 [Trematomus bernacchii]|uniref:apoptosis regulator BAX-like isoform X1 n=1 Tax=Trematomus bernacchii TaxID=40690 RepID=UPI00146E376D|nr:apoptosis regulator BAX-like isoform X1 [Trematomus bernacchii]
MACEGDDVRIGEALIKEVINAELKALPSQDVPPLTTPTAEVENEQEQKVVDQLANITISIEESLYIKRLQDAIDAVARSSGSKLDMFKKVAVKVFKDGITWEKIAILFYIAGKLAVKMVVTHLPESLMEIQRWTVDFFKNNLLVWIQEHGGWINSFSELAQSSMQRVSTMSTHTYGLVGIGILIAGLATGRNIPWRLS